jgi:hypothetical protein
MNNPRRPALVRMQAVEPSAAIPRGYWLRTGSRLHSCTPHVLASTTARGHLPQHFIRYQRLARDQVAGAWQVFQTQAQRIVQLIGARDASDGARIDAHHTPEVAQSRSIARVMLH